jgi:elongation factor Ts
MSSIEQIKELRAATGAGLADVKEALEISKGDVEAAKAYLQKKGMAKAEKRADREANQGIVASYVHTNSRVAVMVEVNCETDFVARSEDFIQFGKDVAMQIAAMSPLYLSKEDIPSNIVEEFRNEVGNDPKFAGKPSQVVETIIEQKMKTYAEETCLLEQTFFKDGSQKIGDMMKSVSGKVGEAVRVRRFTRYEVGA